MSAVPHQRYLADISVALVITIMYVSKWQYNMLPTTLFQDHNLVSAMQVFLGSSKKKSH